MYADMRLENLIEKYGIYDDSESIKKFMEVKRIIRRMIERIPSGKTIAVWAGGEHTYCLLSDLGSLASRISYVIDKKGTCNELNLKAIAPDKIYDMEIDYIIISTYQYRYEIINEIQKNGQSRNFEVIDLYEHLAQEGIVLTNHYYQMAAFDWSDIYFIKNKMLLERNVVRKSHYYREIISMYVFLRDFLSAFEWIDKVPEELKIDFDRFYDFENEVRQLFLELAQNISKKKAIVINWIDALMPSELTDMPYLKQVADSGVEFTNAFTAVPVTSMAMAVMHTGKFPIEDIISPDLFISADHSVFIQTLEKLGYGYLYCGQWHWRKFEAENKCKKYQTAHSFVPMTVYQWEAVCLLAEGRGSECIMIHNVLETHVPNICGDLSMMRPVSHLDVLYDITGTTDEVGRQIAISRRYVDKQLEWYAKFYSEDTIKIYMSDHGKNISRNVCDESVDHIVLLAAGKNVAPVKIDRYFTNMNLSKLIENILTDKKIEQCCQDYAKIENIDTYNAARNKRVLFDAIDDCEYNLLDEFAYKIVRSREGFYIIRVNGEEYFEADDSVDKERFLNKMRDIAGTQFIDIYQHEEYQACRVLYNYFHISKSDKITYF